MSAKVRYQVLQATFVNGSYVEPGNGETFVYAAPGLAGPALKLAPEAAPTAGYEAKAKSSSK